MSPATKQTKKLPPIINVFLVLSVIYTLYTLVTGEEYHLFMTIFQLILLSYVGVFYLQEALRKRRR